MRRLVLALGLWIAPVCMAQQPDLRLQMFSLYRIQKAALHPLDGARLHWCAQCASTPWRQPLLISSVNSQVRNDDDGKTAAGLWLEGGVRVEFDGVPPRTLQMPLEVHAKAGVLIFIARMTLEQYTATVVQGETSGDMPAEALRAMAVAARTYGTHFRERHKADRFDFCDSTHCQFMNANVSPAVRAAVEQTRGELLWELGQPIAAYYHQDCGGKTEAASNAWPKEYGTTSETLSDPYCVRVSKPWRARISRRELVIALKASGLRVPRQWRDIKVLRRTTSGRAQSLLLVSANGGESVAVAASSLRFAVGRAMGWGLLKSDLYEVVLVGDQFVFTGRGTGHGVGLCQRGAAELAREGKSYREILAFYYPASTVSVAASGIPWRKSAIPGLDVFSVDNGSAIALTATRALSWAERQTHMQAVARPSVYIYPSVEMFRDATGEPGWVAASTRGSKIRMQPAKGLGGRAEQILRHEFVHVLLESHADAQAPLWFREGMAMLLSGDSPTDAPTMPPQRMEAILNSREDEKAMQAAYASALNTVARLEREHGRSTLLGWLRRGIPSGILDGGGRAQETAHHR